MDIVTKNIDDIRKKILKAAKGRNITFVAVTKTFGAHEVELALNGGITDIAESRIQEALPKFEALSDGLKGVNKHFIGHLQSNKAKKAVLNFDLIQSLDSADLADEINRHAVSINKIQKCLIELKVSAEETKYGVSKDALFKIYDHCESHCKNVSVCGVMTIAPYFDSAEQARPYFRKAYEVFSALRKRACNENFKILSMGMSGDFEVAIQEGSNMVRIGSAVFGGRIYDK